MKRITLSLFLLLFLPIQTFCVDKDVEIIRGRVLAGILSPSVNNNRVERLITTIKPDGTWPGIDYVDTSREAFQHTRHLENLIQLSRAYAKKGSVYKGNKKVKNAIDLALNYWTVNDFICENWWNNEIGTPHVLMQVLFMMDKSLTKEQVEKTLTIVKRSHLGAWGARESGDRIKIGGIQAKTALYYRDIKEFEYVIDVIESQIKFVTGRGMQHDYSFHHRDDRVNNTLTYGLDYANAFAEWLDYTAGTKYKFSEKPLQQLIDYYLDGICKMMAYGKYPDPGATNRDISRSGSLRASGTKTPERLIAATDYRKNELEQIIGNRKGEELKSLSYGKFFKDSEYYSHQRSNYFTSVRMYSSRNANMEMPYNGEGLLNHYNGDGANYISRTGKEYYNAAPVFDWQKIPGTTILQKPLLVPEKDIQKQGTMDFVGAVTDGLYGAVAFDFRSPHDPIEVKKAWFFFDKEYVCLGTDLHSMSNYPVATTLNQCLLKGDVVAMTGGSEKTLSKTDHTLDNTTWIFHDSVAYFFPKPIRIHLSNRMVSGSWLRVNRQTGVSKEEIRMEMFKLWIDHGKRVSNDGYQYVVIPSVDRENLKEYAVNPGIEILSNTPEVQAVRHKYLNIIQILFYKSEEMQLPGELKIRMDTPGLLMMKVDGNDVKEISVSDPSRKLGRIHFSINRRIEKQGENFISVWNTSNNLSEVSIDLPQTIYAGESVTIKLP
ncbi:MAG: polysaccharide lyase beta-sandwich domain-containing protein [Dysgonamonadaceae bacterium]|jgi:chondroitin AC lyase|nr:polysaccharide lyase beta-sandwich domain-containing protein [Dysgonamonadaceae bacterium]